jgi:hypothetical protein
MSLEGRRSIPVGDVSGKEWIGGVVLTALLKMKEKKMVDGGNNTWWKVGGCGVW